LTYIPAPNRKAQSRMDRVVARWLWDRFIQKRVPWIGLAVVFMVLEAGMLGAFSYLVQPMFDDVLVAGDRGRVVFVALAMACVFFGRGVARLAHRSIMAKLSEQATAELQAVLLGHLATLDQAFFKLFSS